MIDHPNLINRFSFNNSLTGKTNNAILRTGTESYTNGIFGKCLNTNNNLASYDLYTFLNNGNPGDGNGFTTSFWYYKGSNAGTVEEVIMHVGNAGYPVSIELVNGRIIFGLLESNTYFSITYTISNDTWYHFTITAKNNSYARFYVNGTLQYEKSIGNLTIWQSSQHITVGGYLSNTSWSNSFRCRAYIDDVHHYNTVLPQSDIKRIMQGLHPLTRS